MSTVFHVRHQKDRWAVVLLFKAYHISLVFLHQIHFMNKAKYFCIRRVLQNGLETRLVVVHVFLQLATLNVEYINKHLHISENIVPLAGEVVLHECVLSGWHEKHRVAFNEEFQVW